MSNKYNFFAELSRRNVYKVSITYGVIAWLFFEILAVLLPPDAASSVLNVFLILGTLGFILALYISWSFEATPEGLKRTEKVPPGVVLRTWSRRKYATFVIGNGLRPWRSRPGISLGRRRLPRPKRTNRTRRDAIAGALAL